MVKNEKSSTAREPIGSMPLQKCVSSPTQFSAQVVGHWSKAVLQNVGNQQAEAVMKAEALKNVVSFADEL